MSHSIVTLFKAYDESMDIFDLIFKHINQTINGSFFFNQIISKTRSIHYRKNRFGDISQIMTCVMASIFRNWGLIMSKTEDFETSVIETDSIEIFVTAQ